jgi:hypothetical protein
MKMRLFIKVLSVVILLLFSVFLLRGLIFTTNELEIKSRHKEVRYNEPDYNRMRNYLRNERELLDKACIEVRISGK